MRALCLATSFDTIWPSWPCSPSSLRLGCSPSTLPTPSLPSAPIPRASWCGARGAPSALSGAWGTRRACSAGVLGLPVPPRRLLLMPWRCRRCCRVGGCAMCVVHLPLLESVCMLMGRCGRAVLAASSAPSLAFLVFPLRFCSAWCPYGWAPVHWPI